MTALATSHPPIPARPNSPLPVKPLQSDREDADAPTLPPAVPKLDPDDYPNACYWTQSSWTEYKKKRINQGFPVYGLNFMHDEDGEKISDDWLGLMTNNFGIPSINTIKTHPLGEKRPTSRPIFSLGTCETVSLSLDSARAAGRLRCLPLSVTLTGLPKFEILVLFYVCFSSF